MYSQTSSVSFQPQIFGDFLESGHRMAEPPRKRTKYTTPDIFGEFLDNERAVLQLERAVSNLKEGVWNTLLHILKVKSTNGGNKYFFSQASCVTEKLTDENTPIPKYILFPEVFEVAFNILDEFLKKRIPKKVLYQELLKNLLSFFLHGKYIFISSTAFVTKSRVTVITWLSAAAASL